MPQKPVRIEDIGLAFDKVEGTIAALRHAFNLISTDPDFEVMVEMGPFPQPIPRPGPPPPFTGTCSIEAFLFEIPHGDSKGRCQDFDPNSYLSELAGFLSSMHRTLNVHFEHSEHNE